MDNTTDSTAVTDGGATVLLNLESLIKTYISDIDRLKEDLKVDQDMLNSLLEGDPTYQECTAKAKDVTKAKSEIKQRILQQSQARELDAKVKDAKTNLKEKEIGLSDYLREYQRIAGTNQIEGADGEMLEIVNTAKLIKKYT